MPKAIDITGERYGRLTVISKAQIDKPRSWWVCKCDCGSEKIVSADALRRGAIVSCGCYHKERMAQINTKHGCAARSGVSRLYNIWSGMVQRCSNKNNPEYRIYGGRGICICEEWKNDFREFKKWAEEHGYKNDLTIDRIDNNLGYYPENCRFVTRKGQQNNLRRTIKYIFKDGEVLALSDISEKTEMRKAKVQKFLKKYVVEEKESGFGQLRTVSCNIAFLLQIRKEGQQ